MGAVQPEPTAFESIRLTNAVDKVKELAKKSESDYALGVYTALNWLSDPDEDAPLEEED